MPGSCPMPRRRFRASIQHARRPASWKMTRTTHPVRRRTSIRPGLRRVRATQGQALFPVYDTRRTPLVVLDGQVSPRDACCPSSEAVFFRVGSGRPADQRPRTRRQRNPDLTPRSSPPGVRARSDGHSVAACSPEYFKLFRLDRTVPPQAGSIRPPWLSEIRQVIARRALGDLGRSGCPRAERVLVLAAVGQHDHGQAIVGEPHHIGAEARRDGTAVRHDPVSPRLPTSHPNPSGGPFRSSIGKENETAVRRSVAPESTSARSARAEACRRRARRSIAPDR